MLDDPELERVPDNKNTFPILTFFSNNYRSFHVRYFKKRSNIFKNAFMCSFFFRNDGIVLDNFVCSHERMIRANSEKSNILSFPHI